MYKLYLYQVGGRYQGLACVHRPASDRYTVRWANCHRRKGFVEMAKIRYREKEWEVEHGITVRDAIRETGMDIHSVLALRDKKLIKGQTVVEPGDEIRLVNIVSGG